MRALFSAILCLSMVVCILANNFIIGERQEGDYLLTDRTILKPAISWKNMIAGIHINCPRDEIITFVNITSLDTNKEVNFNLRRGNIGTNYVNVIAVGELGEGLHLDLKAYAKKQDS